MNDQTRSGGGAGTGMQARALEGRCTCGGVRYRLTRRPLFVHCCHCRWCQRETGSAFVLNALIETENLHVVAGTPEPVDTPSESGRGQLIYRCPQCHVALWSRYSSDAVRFVRVGTLDHPDAVPPDVHIFTASKQPWVVLPDGASVFEAYYDPDALWPESSLRRLEAVRRRHRGGQGETA